MNPENIELSYWSNREREADVGVLLNIGSEP